MILGMFSSSTVGKTIPDDSPSSAGMKHYLMLCCPRCSLSLAKVVDSAHPG